MPSFDAIVIGGGHNGLAAAALLGKAGRKVVLLEADATLGGAARTVEFHPGFRASEVAHLVTHLPGRVIDELGLARHGLDIAGPSLPSIALERSGRHLVVTAGDVGGDVAEGEAAAFHDLNRKLALFAATLKPALAKAPPRLATRDRQSALSLARLGLDIRRLGRRDMRELLRMILMNIADVLDEELTDDRLKGLVAFDATLGTHLGPMSPGSLLSYLYRLAGDVAGAPQRLILPKGGMGSVILALAGAAKAAGVLLRPGAPVERILVEGGRARGVALEGGEKIEARLVVSAANPRQTLLDMVGARALDTDVVRRVSAIRMNGNAGRLLVALDGLPEIAGLDRDRLAARMVIAPSMRAVEEAFNPAKYGELPERPVMEMVLPSISDPSLAPAGRHVLSVTMQFVPYRLTGDWSEAAREELKARVLSEIEAHLPGIGRLVRHAELMTPADIERRCRMPGGHWHHGEMTVDQMFFLRPFQAAAQYSTPIDGLYLAGAGSHPGGNVMGLAAMNAVRTILETEGRR